MLFAKLLPREGNFFEMFNQHADRIVEAAQAPFELQAATITNTQAIDFVVVFVDADISGDGTWVGISRIQVLPGAKGHAHIDKRLHPYWLRIRTAPGTDAIADITFR